MEPTMISCKRATELLSQQMDQKLSLWQRFVLRFHLLMCSACRQFGVQMDELRVFSRRFVDRGTEIGGSQQPEYDEVSRQSDETHKKSDE